MKALVDYLINIGVLKSSNLVEAFLANDRRDFVLQENQNFPYSNKALSIGYGQSISQPYTVAFMMELLQPKSGEKVLDVGFGSGWTTGILANVVGKQGLVYAVELIPEVFQFGNENLRKYQYSNIIFFQSSWEDVPIQEFDCILVSAVAKSLPEKLLAKLKIGGRMVIPIRTGYSQEIQLVKKTGDNKVIKQSFPGFVFVPLV